MTVSSIEFAQAFVKNCPNVRLDPDERRELDRLLQIAIDLGFSEGKLTQVAKTKEMLEGLGGIIEAFAP